VITAEPSIALDDGMIFLIDGDPVLGPEARYHLCPLARSPTATRSICRGISRGTGRDDPASSMDITLMRGRRRDESAGQVERDHLDLRHVRRRADAARKKARRTVPATCKASPLAAPASRPPRSPTTSSASISIPVRRSAT
jgi:hypothetical protein